MLEKKEEEKKAVEDPQGSFVYFMWRTCLDTDIKIPSSSPVISRMTLNKVLGVNSALSPGFSIKTLYGKHGNISKKKICI